MVTYGRILLLGAVMFVTGGALGRWGGYLAVAAFLGTPVAALVYLSLRPTGVNDPDATLAAIEQSTEADEPESRWERKQRVTRHWRAATPARGAEVRRLVKEHRGALVRVRPDSTAELLTGRKGESLRYVVAEDGTSTLAETISDSTHKAFGRMALGGLVLLVAGVRGWAARQRPLVRVGSLRPDRWRAHRRHARPHGPGRRTDGARRVASHQAR